MRATRDRGASTVEELNDAGTETATQEKANEGTTETKRAPRPSIDTSGIVVGDAVEDDGTFGKRASKLDTDPVAVAVREAEQGKWVPLMVGEGSTVDSVRGIKSLVTRAASRAGLGVNFETKKLADGLLYFRTGEKRKVNRKPKTEAATTDTTNQ